MEWSGVEWSEVTEGVSQWEYNHQDKQSKQANEQAKPHQSANKQAKSSQGKPSEATQTRQASDQAINQARKTNTQGE